MKNEKGGIISKVLFIPTGVALILVFFLLGYFVGYYVGKYQGKSGIVSEVPTALTEGGSKNPPKQEEFTFYKTLTDKENKTVSINLKPAPANEESAKEKEPTAVEPSIKPLAQPPTKEKRIEIIAKKDTAAPAPTQKEAPVPVSSNAKLRYTIQIASYQEKEMADDVVKRLKKKGYAAFIASSELPGKGLWHRVKVGSFSNKAAAEKLQKELHAKAGVSPIVVLE